MMISCFLFNYFYFFFSFSLNVSRWNHLNELFHIDHLQHLKPTQSKHDDMSPSHSNSTSSVASLNLLFDSNQTSADNSLNSSSPFNREGDNVNLEKIKLFLESPYFQSIKSSPNLIHNVSHTKSLSENANWNWNPIYLSDSSDSIFLVGTKINIEPPSVRFSFDINNHSDISFEQASIIIVPHSNDEIDSTYSILKVCQNTSKFSLNFSSWGTLP
jgi:hypothetical protein